MQTFSLCNFFVFRSPRLSLGKLKDFSHIKSSFEQEQFLKELFSNRDMREAILVASPVLYKRMEKWLSTGKIDNKLQYTMYKYFLRMVTRSTPFGHFSGIGVGEVIEKKTVILRNDTYIRKYKLDRKCITAIIDKISEDTDIATQLCFYPNNTLYRQDNVYKFYCAIEYAGGLRYFLNSVNYSLPIQYVLTLASKGITQRKLVDSLSVKGANRIQAKYFIDQLIKNQVLISELQQTMTGEDYYVILLEKLKCLDLKRQYLPTLKKLYAQLQSCHPLLNRYNEINKLLKQLGIDKLPPNIIHSDQIIGTKGSEIRKCDAERLLKQLEELLPFRRSSDQFLINRFKEAFLKRYEGRIISLVEALDPDTGLGLFDDSDYTQADDLLSTFRKICKQRNVQKNELDNQDIIQRKYLEYIKTKNKVISIDEEDLQGNTKLDSSNNLSSTFYALGTFFKGEKNLNFPKFHLYGYGGISASNLLTRFGYLDKNLSDDLRNLCDYEQQKHPNCIFAEVVHIPDTHAGNILHRPVLRSHEIVMLASSNNQCTEIAISDLYLFIKDRKLVLWSKKFDREVVPRLSSAHNYQKKGITLYRFLCAFQEQENQLNVMWDWGSLSNFTFLPRVVYKDIILSRARWFFPKFNSTKDKIQSLQKLIEEYEIPRYVTLSDNDSELTLDIKNDLSRRILLEHWIKKDLVLHEFLYAEFESLVKDVDGNQYCNEIVLPIKRSVSSHENVKPTEDSGIKRFFPLGSEWVYLKIYCGVRYSEKLLNNEVKKIICILEREGILDKWFFIRYKDPENHIRLRIAGKCCTDSNAIVMTINDMLAPLLEQGLIAGLQFDVYKREIERYSRALMERSEDFFIGIVSFVSI
jgi:thiopeptide-type bacteriocin biosynthesis domain